MSIEKAKAHLKKWGADEKVMEFEVSSATVELAAKAIGTEPERIAKSLSFALSDGRCVLVVAAGDTKVDNKKFKAFFGCKASMLPFEEVEAKIGHAVGGVCPFGINDGVEVFLDESLKRFTTVFPAAGGSNTALEMTLDELFEYSGAKEWIDVTALRV